MLNVLLTLVGGNWKTTLAGFISAVAVLVLPILQSGRMPTLQEWILAIALTIVGRMAKDHDVTGGTRNVPPITIDHGGGA